MTNNKNTQHSQDMDYEVLAGTWDDNEPNCKVAISFSNFPGALEVFNSESNRAWACLLYNGQLIMGHNPLEEFHSLEEEYYNPCDHCCEFCESDSGCPECNPRNLPSEIG